MGRGGLEDAITAAAVPLATNSLLVRRTSEKADALTAMQDDACMWPCCSLHWIPRTYRERSIPAARADRLPAVRKPPRLRVYVIVAMCKKTRVTK